MAGGKRSDERQADVCLVLEGGFPEATGGVSVWVNELTRNLFDVRFAVANLREEGDPTSPRLSDAGLADNVVSLVDVPVDPDLPRLPAACAAGLPEASVYHACITGNASDAAAHAAAVHGRPMLLTEHGLAWREAGWISGCKITGCKITGGIDPLRDREATVQRILAQARHAYRAADAVTSVCSANVAAQRGLGAPAERSRLVPNCVPLDVLKASEAPARERSGFTVGFVGRVVPIKDLLTLILAAHLVRQQLPVRFVAVGPLDHDPEYVHGCRELVRSLGLDESFQFVGEADPVQWYPRFDALALTSRSEAQPLALLEAMATGLPTVATRVGGCAELLAGDLRGRPTPQAGLLVAPGDERGVADAILTLARDPALRRRLGAAGRERARGHHHPAQVWGSYRQLYEQVAA
jgi:glycosyltransferase involved in cell wall biosynthesis